MRFAVVTRRFWPLVGESEYVAANMAAALHEAGHDIRILSSRSFPGWPSQFTFRGCPVFRLPSRFPAFRIRRQFERSAFRFLREQSNELDVVLFFQPGFPPGELLARVNRLGMKSIVRLEPTCFGHSATTEIENLNESARNLVRPQLCSFTTSSKSLFDRLKDEVPRLHYLKDGVPVSTVEGMDQADPSNAEADSKARQKKLAKNALSRSHPLLRIRDSEKLAVFAGPVLANQRLDKWIGCWKKVKKNLAGAKIWIVGEGNYQQQLWEQIIDLGLDDHVLMGGVFDDLSSVFDAADLFLLSDYSRLESPFVLLAQSRGLPVIASFEQPELTESFERDHGIILAPDQNPNELSRFVVSILDGGIDPSKIVESARMKVAKSNTMSNSMQGYLALANSMI